MTQDMNQSSTNMTNITLSNAGDWRISSGTTGNFDTYYIGDPYPWYEREFHHWYPITYPSYPVTVYEKSKVDVAFKILKKLFEKKYLKEVSVSKFVELVNEIAKEL